MTQTGTGSTRARKVFRRRVNDLITVPVWWPENPDFSAPSLTTPPDDPAAFIRVVEGRRFERPWALSGGSEADGSFQFLAAIQPRPGMDAKAEAVEAMIRSIANPDENDDAEDVWTFGPVESHFGVSPPLPASHEAIRDEFHWNQYQIPYRAVEVVT